MGMILRIASSRIVGQGDIVGRSGYFSLNLSANSVMRGRLDARRTLKSLVADLRGKKVADERYRILQFMRFQKTTEGIYYGAMEPLYDVFPLTIRHFRDRFADQKWLIYDVKRHYGYYYDGKEVNEITFADPKQTHLLTGKLDESLLDKNEKLFQTLWKSYFKSICIKERLNPVKHKKDMPVRYWKYLTEKN